MQKHSSQIGEQSERIDCKAENRFRQKSMYFLVSISTDHDRIDQSRHVYVYMKFLIFTHVPSQWES